MLILCLIFTGIMTIFAQAIPHLFVAIFTNRQDVAEIAVWGIRVYTSMIFFLSVQYACVDSMTALNVPKVAVTLSLMRKIVVMLTCTLVLPMFFGWKGAFFAEPIADFCSCFISGITFALLINRILNQRSSSVAEEKNEEEKRGTN